MSVRCVVQANVHAKQLEDGIVILDFARGAYFSLDRVGVIVWRGIAAGDSLPTIADLVASTFDVHADVALNDIRSLLDELVAAGLVRIETS